MYTTQVRWENGIFSQKYFYQKLLEIARKAFMDKSTLFTSKINLELKQELEIVWYRVWQQRHKH